MKKFLTILSILTLALAGCEDGTTPDNTTNDTTPAATTLNINNLSDYALFAVEYSSIDFGTIYSGKDVDKEVSAGTKYVFFSLQTVNGRVRCRTEAFTCEDGVKNSFTITNNSVVTTTVTERTNTLRNLVDTLNNEPANPAIKILYENYPVASGGTIPLNDIPKGQKQTVSLKIVNEGEHDLRITGTKPQISGANAALVVAGNYPSVRLAYSESTTFSVEFTPSVKGENSFTITIINNDQVNGTYTVTVTANVISSWQKLYGEAGKRSGIFRAISNGSGGIYAGGFTSNNTAALFNIDENGNMQNKFTIDSFDGTIGPTGIGSGYNDYFAVFWAISYGEYYITKINNPATYPTFSNDISLTFNNKKMDAWPAGIVYRGGYYFVAGNADFYDSPEDIDATNGIFVNRHDYYGTFEKATALSVSLPGITANSFQVHGITVLSNGDILLYGEADKSGRSVAFACAVDVSAADSALWNIRWSNYYEIPGEASIFYNHFFDNSSNIVLLGLTECGGLVVKFPANAAAAAAAKPAGWPKTIAGTDAGFTGGLAASDGSGYIFVGVEIGTHGEQDIWVVKTDPDAEKLWDVYFGGPGIDFGNAIIEQSDGFIIAGSTHSPVIAGQSRTGTEDIYILKINKDGTLD